MGAGRSLVFMGSKTAGLSACRTQQNLLPEAALAAIICPDDRSDSRSVLYAFKELAHETGVPLHLAGDSAPLIEVEVGAEAPCREHTAFAADQASLIATWQ